MAVAAAIVIAVVLGPAEAAQAQGSGELTPAQQCVSHGYPIPTVGKPAAADIRRARRLQTVGGWAFLDGSSPVVGGKVQLRTRRGEKIRLSGRSSRRTNRRGAFIVGGRSLPRSVTVVVKGGRVDGERFAGTLRRRNVLHRRGAIAHVNPASSVVAAYQRAYPGSGEAVDATRRLLRVPPGFGLEFDLRFSDQLFDGERFLGYAARSGGVQVAIRRLARRAYRDGRRAFRGRARPGEDEEVFDLLTWSGGQLAGAAGSYAGGEAVGWVMSQFGIQSGIDSQMAELRNLLDQINNKLTEISRQLKDLNNKADKLILATTVAGLRNMRTAIAGKAADIAWIADMSAGPVDKAYLEQQTCGKLAGLYPLASGTADYGYAPDFINGAFFPEPGVTPLTPAFVSVIKDESRWFGRGSSDAIASMVEYWTGIEQSWLQIKLEWEHAVHPCPPQPAPTAQNCEALRWAGRYIADAAAHSDTRPKRFPAGAWVDSETNLAWAPTFANAGALQSPPPANYADTFGPFNDWVQGLTPRDACRTSGVGPPDPQRVSLCRIVGGPGPHGAFDAAPVGTGWMPPTASQIWGLAAGYRQAGFASPLDYLTATWDKGGAGASREWLEGGANRVWTYPCRKRGEESPYACYYVDLADPSRSADADDGRAGAGFLLNTEFTEPTRYTVSRPRVRYVEANGTDTSNDCKSYVLPCRTIGHAADQAGYSETIRIGAGVFTGPVTLSRNNGIVGAGAQLTVIQAGATGSAVTLGTENNVAARIERVTVRSGPSDAAAIRSAAGNHLAVAGTVVSSTSGADAAGLDLSGNTVTTIVSSTIGPNSAAGIKASGNASVKVTNSTVAGNLDGITAEDAAKVDAVSSTIGGNDVFGVTSADAAVVRLGSSVLGGNDRDGYGVGDCQGQVRSLPGGHNLFGNSSGCGFDGAGAPGNIVGTAAAPADPQLGPLKINGGQTPTVALPATSPAAGGGDPAVCAAAPVDGFDQRAFTRPSGACDIGAFDHLARNVPPGG